MSDIERVAEALLIAGSANGVIVNDWLAEMLARVAIAAMDHRVGEAEIVGIMAEMMRKSV